VFEAFNGACHLSGRKIRPGEKWEVEHMRALINGGENREINLAPVLSRPHKEKTKMDVAEKATTYRVRAKHIGVFAPRKKIQSAPFRKSAPQRTATRPISRRHGEG
jgi:hypothetical protein